MSNSTTSEISHARNFWLWRVICSVGFILILLVMVIAETNAQATATKDIEDRFALRADTASTFMTAYINQVMTRERELASLRLGTEQVTHEQFLLYVESLNFGPSILLDSEGNVIEAAPLNEDIIGSNLSKKYDHIEKAVNGKANVSNKVESAVQGIPIVAFVTPYQSAAGTRIVSGAYDLANTPIGKYLDNISQFQTGEAYLLDADNNVVSSSSDKVGVFDKVNARLSDAAAAENSQGQFKLNNGDEAFFVTRQIDDTPWHIVITVSGSELYQPVSGTAKYLPWLFITCFGLVSAFMLVKLLRDREKRIRLQDSSLVDLLTGVANRKGGVEALTRLLAFSKRHAKAPSILYIDVDDFKAFNDKFSHSVGDKTLKAIAQNISSCLRAEDEVARWDGDEFIVILPDTPAQGAKVAAERINERLLRDIGEVEEERISVSLGIVTFDGEESLEDFVARGKALARTISSNGGNAIDIG